MYHNTSDVYNLGVFMSYSINIVSEWLNDDFESINTW